MRRALIVPTLVLALAAAACGRLTGTGDGPIEHPDGPDDLVLRVERGGGLVPIEWTLRQIPAFSLYGDGRFIVPGPQIEIYPGPALPNLLVGRVTEEGMQAILRAAREAGLLGSDRHLDWPTVTDASTSTFTVDAGGGTHIVSAYALGLEEDSRPPGVSQEEMRLRRALAEFEAKLSDLGSWLPDGSYLPPDEPYRFAQLRAVVLPYSADPELPQPDVAWPLTEPLTRFGEPRGDLFDARCGVVDGDDLARLLPDAEAANELTPWVSDGDRYLVIVRPLLPDETGC